MKTSRIRTQVQFRASKPLAKRKIRVKGISSIFSAIRGGGNGHKWKWETWVNYQGRISWLCRTSTRGHGSLGKMRKEQSHLCVFMDYKKLSQICLETLRWTRKPCVLPRGRSMASYSPCPLTLSFGRSQFTLTFPKQMEGGAEKGLALEKEISAVWSHKIPRAWEHTWCKWCQEPRRKQKVLSSLGGRFCCLKWDILGSKALNDQTIQLHLPVHLHENRLLLGMDLDQRNGRDTENGTEKEPAKSAPLLLCLPAVQ